MEIIGELFKIGGPVTVTAGVGLWLYLRVDTQRADAEKFTREILAKALDAAVKAAEADTRMALAIDGMAKRMESLDRGRS